MTTLLHGQNQVALKRRLSQIEGDFVGEIISLDGKTISEELLIQNLNSNSLFKVKKLIIIENLSTNSHILKKLTTDAEIILVEDKKLSPTQIKTISQPFLKIHEEEFKTDPIVFKFLDSLEPGNSTKTFKFWEDYKDSEVPEVILVMLARQIRLLLLAKTSDPETSPEWSRLSPWQQQKLTSQAEKFPLSKLKEHFSRLCNLDHKSKTGQLTLDLNSSLELFLLALTTVGLSTSRIE